MLDLGETLQPSSGIVRRYSIAPPWDSPLWNALADIGLSEASEECGREDDTFVYVGAYGWTRQSTLTRCCGESVERYSLIQPQTDPLVVHRGTSGLGNELVEACLLAPGGESVSTDLAYVVEPSSGESPEVAQWDSMDPAWPRRTVPVWLLTDPPSDTTWIDASPSATAAGPSQTSAARSALLESIERDAIQYFWALRPALTFYDSILLTSHLDAIPKRNLADVQDYLQAHALEARTLLAPTDVHGIHIGVTFVDGEYAGNPILSMGGRASDSPVECVEASLREALQVHVAMRTQVDHHPESRRIGPIRDDITRSWYCMSPAARDHYRGWLARASQQILPNDDIAQEDVTFTDLVSHMRHAGLRPLLADLTPRLPTAVQSLGWHSLRALVLGHQPYRMDETRQWTWSSGRLAKWRARLSDSEEVPLSRVPPHPLI